MYQPNYQYSNKLVSDLLKVERVKFESENTSSAVIRKLAALSKSLSIFHFSNICGVQMTLNDAQKAAEGSPVETNDPRGQIITNFRSVYEFTRANANTSYDADIDANMLLHINRLLLSGWKESWEAKFRSSPDETDATLDNWVQLRDVGVAPASVFDELTNAINWFQSMNGLMPDLVRIGIFISRLIELAPFVFLNKLTIIAIADHLFYKCKFSDQAVYSIVRNFDVHDQEYQEAIVSGREFSADRTLFLERFCEYIFLESKSAKEEADKATRIEEESNQKPFLNLNKRQLKILKYLQTIPVVRREDYVQMMDVSTMTAYRDLNELTEKKLIKVFGKGRSTKYSLYNR